MHSRARRNDLRSVIMSLQLKAVVEVKLLHLRVRRKRVCVGELDLEHPPRRPSLAVGSDFVGGNILPGQVVGEVEVLPQSIAREVQELQIAPWRLELVLCKGVARVVQRRDDLAVFGFVHSLRSEHPFLVCSAAEANVGHLLFFGGHGSGNDEMMRLVLELKQYTGKVELDCNAAQLRVALQAAMGLNN